MTPKKAGWKQYIGTV